VRWYLQRASTKARRRHPCEDDRLPRRRHSVYIAKECMPVEIKKNAKNNTRRKKCILIYIIIICACKYTQRVSGGTKKNKKIRRTSLTRVRLVQIGFWTRVEFFRPSYYYYSRFPGRHSTVFFSVGLQLYAAVDSAECILLLYIILYIQVLTFSEKMSKCRIYIYIVIVFVFFYYLAWCKRCIAITLHHNHLKYTTSRDRTSYYIQLV